MGACVKFLLIGVLIALVIFYCLVMLILVGTRRRYERRVRPQITETSTYNKEDLIFMYANGMSTEEIQMAARLREDLR
jgi:membrane protein implicated in regulation of membrane protease activity